MARSGCLWGGTGSRKTTQGKFFSHYIADTTGKATLLLSADGGGWEPCQPEIQAGMIRPFRCNAAEMPLTLLELCSRGQWPKHPEAPTAQGLGFEPVNWDEVGGIIVEGWTSIGQVLMRYLPAEDINVGGEERKKLGGFSQSVDLNGNRMKLNFYSNTRGDFGFVQNMLYGLVMKFNSLPVRYVLYTALEAKTEDDDRSTVYGPAIVGKKATSQCGAWVGDLIHAQDYAANREETVPAPNGKPGETVKQSTVDMTVRFYFKKHLDPATGIPYPAKTRVTPERIAELDGKFPGGYFESSTEWGIDRYLAATDELASKQAKSETLKDWRQRADAKLGRGKAAAAAVTEVTK